MIKITKTYTDFEGNELTETAWFHMSKAQLVEFATELPDGMVKSFDENELEASAAKLIDSIGEKGVVNFLKDLVIRSYGIRGEDNKSFKKSAAISEEFSQTLLFDEIFMELVSDSAKMQEFVENVIPTDLGNKARQQIQAVK